MASPTVFAEDPFDFNIVDTSAPNHWQFSGYFESRNQYFSTEKSWASNRVAGFFELKWENIRNDNGQWRAYASTQVEYDLQTRIYRDPERVELKELYLLWDATSFDLTLGKQRVAWGTADGVSSIDRINAVDLRDPIGNARTASRRPSWLVRSELNLSLGILDIVWLPRGRDRKLPEYGSPWELAGLNSLRAQHRSGLVNLRIDDPHKGEGGIRYAVYGEGIDWSFAYFNGYTDGPVRQSANLKDILLTPIRIETFNVSSAIGLAQSTFRAEFTYTPDTIVSGKDTDLWQVIIGWDRTFFTSLNTNLQFFYDSAVDGVNRYGTTFSISSMVFDDTVNYGVRGQALNQKQLAAELFFDYKFGDDLTLNMNYLVFHGAVGSRLFDYRNNDFIGFTLRWDF